MWWQQAGTRSRQRQPAKALPNGCRRSCSLCQAARLPAQRWPVCNSMLGPPKPYLLTSPLCRPDPDHPLRRRASTLCWRLPCPRMPWAAWRRRRAWQTLRPPSRATGPRRLCSRRRWLRRARARAQVGISCLGSFAGCCLACQHGLSVCEAEVAAARKGQGAGALPCFCLCGCTCSCACSRPERKKPDQSRFM